MTNDLLYAVGRENRQMREVQSSKYHISDDEKSKNDIFSTESTYNNEAFDWNGTAASLSQVSLLLNSSTFYRLDLCFHKIKTFYDISQVRFSPS